MPLKRVAPVATWSVTIEWSRPVIYDNLKHYHSNADHQLYMILGSHGDSPLRLFYIGRTKLNAAHRLDQSDHVERKEKLRRKHPRHKFLVSCGRINVEKGKVTRHRVDHIETLLIYTEGEMEQYLINDKKVWTHTISDAYQIRNRGYRKPLPKEIHLGIFAK